MKISHKGYVYESMTPQELEIEYSKFINGEPFKFSTELLDYAKSRESSGETISTEDYYDLADELEKNLSLGVSSILSKWNIEYREVSGNYVYSVDGDYYIIMGRVIIPVDKLISHPASYHEEFPEYAEFDQVLNSDFWKYPDTLYHATDCDNMELILRDGLNTSRGSGITNRGVSGVFTSTEPDGYIDSYGDCKVAIDVYSMKRDGNAFFVEREPEVFEYLLSSAISHRYGIEVTVEPSHSGGMDHNTWIVNDHIPAKYLSNLAEEE